ncbi:DsbA family protein [Patescibacteria group bacterium]|nr:DsbA family protein [Patescibacteria group bacterium]
MKKSTKFWIKWVCAIVLTMYIATKLATPDTIQIPLANALTDQDHIQGNPEAEVILIEYSDFECPACAYFAEMTNDIVAEFGNHIAFAYRHYPLTSIHDNALPAAYAAEAAGSQGKFWEMHDLLFEKQNKWASSANPFNEYSDFATTLGLDLEQFSLDYESRTLRAKVQTDLDSAEDMGLYYTPSFFLNGELINNPKDHEQFRTLIREALK